MTDRPRRPMIEWIERQFNTPWSAGFSEEFQRGYDTAVEEASAAYEAECALRSTPTQAETGLLREALTAGDALNLAGGSRNAQPLDPEHPGKSRRPVWFEASRDWYNVATRLRAALATEAAPTLDADRLAAGIKSAIVVRLIAGDTNQTYTPTEVATLVSAVVDEQYARLTSEPDR